MKYMGIWVENFSVPAVISNCLIHGHGETVRLFPNWNLNEQAAFSGHRVSGAFLVSAACADGRVTGMRVCSEKGGEFTWQNPETGYIDTIRFAPGETKQLI